MASDGNRLARLVNPISRAASWISYAALFAMMVFVFADVILRHFGRPTSGSNDVVQLMTLVAVAFAFSYTQVLKRNPSTSFIVTHLPLKGQEAIALVNAFVSLVPFALLVWTSAELAMHLRDVNEGTMTLGVPLYPFVYCIAFGSALMCLVLLADFVGLVMKKVKR